MKLAEDWVRQWEGRILDESWPNECPAIDTIADVHLDGESEPLWQFILACYKLEMSPKVFAILAAGPLEDFLADFGPIYIERVETLARQDPKFNDLLGGVWRNSINEEVWERVCRIRNNVW